MLLSASLSPRSLWHTLGGILRSKMNCVLSLCKVPLVYVVVYVAEDNNLIKDWGNVLCAHGPSTKKAIGASDCSEEEMLKTLI